jgi:hypothetical protein
MYQVELCGELILETINKMLFPQRQGELSKKGAFPLNPLPAATWYNLADVD